MRNKKSGFPTILIVLLLIFILIVFVASLGNANPENIGKIPDEFKDSKEEARLRHKRLVELIKKQETLRKKLLKKFKNIYFLVRVGLVLLWIGLMFSLYISGIIENLGDALNYSEASILILIALNFITFGTITDLKNFIEIIKIRTENWVYGKYINIDMKIEGNKEELTILEKEIEIP